MGCNPLGNVLRRLRAKVNRRRSLKAHQLRERMAKSVIPTNDNPIYVAHPPSDLANTTHGPLPPTPIHNSTHVFPANSDTKEVLQVRFSEPDTHDSISTVDFYRDRNDPEWSRHESGFASYSNGSPVSGPGNEDGSRRDYYCGEYHYYPTPVREGTCNLAADSNRLTTIFSDENPNACNIV
ncbi:uncharacterized protein LOC131234517 [Magnolia sinica]|uniref:uncharacterized protein LOC131234517 n=1 Tax=Magnolia sinica TaxID=86752 RepID=UPI00265A9B3A|nr:uncharacterized protein LOC131234517 [Magnolia sinica]